MAGAWMIGIGFSIFVLIVAARLFVPLVRSPARDALGVSDVPFDGS